MTTQETTEEIKIETIINSYYSEYTFEEYENLTQEEKIKELEKLLVNSEEHIIHLSDGRDMYRKFWQDAKSKLDQINQIIK